MAQLVPEGKPTSVYRGKLFDVSTQKMRADDIQFTFERVRRPPGTRLIILKGDQILITREYRTEYKEWDYRLPGGKVFDSLEEFLTSTALDKDAECAARKEAEEEAGITPSTLELYHISRAGATIEWDLYYYIVDTFTQTQQNLEPGEEIEVLWMTRKEVRELCISGKMREDRTVGVLLRFLHE